MKKVIVSIIFVLIIFSYISGAMQKKIIEIYALYKTDLIKIDSISYLKVGKPQVLVIGRNRKGDKKAVWINTVNAYINLKVEGQIEMKNKISKETALMIAKQLNYSDSIDAIELRYFSRPPMYFLKTGAYWFIRIYTDNGNTTVYLYIDYNSGKYIAVTSRDKILVDTFD